MKLPQRHRVHREIKFLLRTLCLCGKTEQKIYFGSKSATRLFFFLQFIFRGGDFRLAEIVERHVLDDFKILAVAADRIAEDQTFLDAVAAVGMHAHAEPIAGGRRVREFIDGVQAAFAALAALLKPRALMMAAPRCCTVVMKSPFSHASSLMTRGTRLTVDFGVEKSGYIVAL